ncbi:DUF4232 domain-containing protein [Streptomyces sp. NPDC006012]|uniref:DUF4232 domain-containing protein n=1 Tax=Streptomyces sp. NPDC006012 TaxID=3364739 RepID=UPI003691767B
MRAQKLSLLAIAVAAGLSLTACQGGDSESAGTSDSPSAGNSASQNSGTQGSADASTGDEAVNGGAVAGGASGACQTSQLGFSVSGGMAEGTVIVKLKNTGSATCALQGFPGVDLKGKDGTVSADRSKLAAPKASIKPGEETRFSLHYQPNDSGGTGVSFTSLVITPPNETHSYTLPVGINLPVTAGSGSGITVDPVGTGK